MIIPVPNMPEGVNAGRLGEFEFTAREVAHDQCQTGRRKATGEAAAGFVVAGEQEVEGEDEDRVEHQTGGDLEDDGAVAWGQRASGDEPGDSPLRHVFAFGIVSACRCVVVTDLFGDRLEAYPPLQFGAVAAGDEPVEMSFAAADEDRSGDSGAGRDEDGELPEGVPDADVERGSHYDVLAVAHFIGELAEVDGSRIR